MFTVNVEGKNFRVRFEHIKDAFLDDYSGLTFCTIRSAETNNFCNQGVAFCSKLDQYNKNIGRKIALRRALEKEFSDPNVRKMFWDAYYQARGGKW